jgi:hypothetical protein
MTKISGALTARETLTGLMGLWVRILVVLIIITGILEWQTARVLESHLPRWALVAWVYATNYSLGFTTIALLVLIIIAFQRSSLS